MLKKIIWGCNYYQYQFTPGRIIWDKCNGASSFSDCEIAYSSMHDSTRLFRFMWNGMMQGNKKLNEKRIHPTQKPVALYKWLLTKYATTGQRILDTHLGSGSIAIACHDLGYELTGIELDQHYFEASAKRIKQHQSL